jgi:hypothetical protein
MATKKYMYSSHQPDKQWGFLNDEFDIIYGLIGSGGAYDSHASAPAQAVYVDAAGEVGIGTTTPTSLLHLRHTSNARIKIESTAGNSQATLLLDNDAQTWGLHLDGLDSDNFTIRDTTASDTKVVTIEPGAPANSLYIDSTGVVGLGTASPDTELHVKNTGQGVGVHVQADAAQTAFVKLTGGTSAQSWQLQIGSGSSIISLYDNTYSVSPFKVEANGVANSLYIDSSGNVGIGRNPSSKFEVYRSGSSQDVPISIIDDGQEWKVKKTTTDAFQVRDVTGGVSNIVVAAGSAGVYSLEADGDHVFTGGNIRGSVHELYFTAQDFILQQGTATLTIDGSSTLPYWEFADTGTDAFIVCGTHIPDEWVGHTLNWVTTYAISTSGSNAVRWNENFSEFDPGTDTATAAGGIIRSTGSTLSEDGTTANLIQIRSTGNGGNTISTGHSLMRMRLGRDADHAADTSSGIFKFFSIRLRVAT